MFARKVVSLALVVAVAGTVFGSGAGTALAGADVCPEPNDQLASACFIGPNSPVPGFIDTPDDIDGYKIELPPDRMIVATLGSLPADYSLRLHLADGSIRAEATEPGLADKVVRADALPAGTYYLSVASLRGEANSDAPYMLAVAYPQSLALAAPSAPAAPAGTPQGGQGYVPGPARAYGLSPADFPGSYREALHDEPEHGRFFRSVMVSPDVRVVGESIILSNRAVSIIENRIYIQPYGENDETAAVLNEVLELLRTKYGSNVQPTQGWGSEQVYSYAWAGRGIFVRGIALRHRNAVAFVETIGEERLATWDHISALMRMVEGRIWAAVQ